MSDEIAPAPGASGSGQVGYSAAAGASTAPVRGNDELAEAVQENAFAFYASIRDDPFLSVARSFPEQLRFCQDFWATEILKVWREMQHLGSGRCCEPEKIHQLQNLLQQYSGLLNTQIMLNGLDRPSKWRTERLKGQATKRLGPRSEPYLEIEPKHWVNMHPISGIDHLVSSLPTTSIGETILSVFFENRPDPIQNEEEGRDVCLAYIPDWVYFVGARFLGNLGVVIFLGVPIVTGSLGLLSDELWSALVILLLIFVNEYMRTTMRNPAIGLALVFAFASALAGNARSG